MIWASYGSNNFISYRHANDEHDHQYAEKEKHQYFGVFDRLCTNTGESEDGRNQRHNEESDVPAGHRHPLYFPGTFAPLCLASDSPIAMACFLLLTRVPLFPLFRRPVFSLWIACLTDRCAP